MIKKKPILIVADAESVKLYRNVFTSDEIIEKHSIGEAAKNFSACELDMVLLDCGFNPEDGLIFLKTIKSFRPSVPVIFLTDVSSENIAISAFRIGAVEYFKKPVNLFSLKDTIGNLLMVKRSERDRRKRALRPAAEDEEVPFLTTGLPSNLFSALCYIDNNLASLMTLDKLAYAASLSKYHFCRLFKKHTGVSPKKFVSERRIERATKLFEHNRNMSVSLAAFEVGFNDVNIFIRSFKKMMGVTPTAFKRSLGARLSDSNWDYAVSSWQKGPSCAVIGSPDKQQFSDIGQFLTLKNTDD
ncbi:MAG: AraC family transcriptional regulator [Nitrospiraceae bacterium]|jgi:AraC family transcriptional regulator|nr:MAG: AraC family transcriptional regulator [Nitrospiraceae bacterium]